MICLCFIVCFGAVTLSAGVVADEKSPVFFNQPQYVATTTPASTVSTKAPSRYTLKSKLDYVKFFLPVETVSLIKGTNKALRTMKRQWREWKK